MLTEIVTTYAIVTPTRTIGPFRSMTEATIAALTWLPGFEWTVEVV